MFENLVSSPLFPFLTFLLGLLVGHRLALGRDKRQEFNKIVAPLRPKILDEAEDPSPMRTAISRHDADAVSSRLGRRQRRAFLETCHQYWEAKANYYQDENGDAFYRDKEPIRKIAKELINYVSVR